MLRHHHPDSLVRVDETVVVVRTQVDLPPSDPSGELATRLGVAGRQLRVRRIPGGPSRERTYPCTCLPASPGSDQSHRRQRRLRQAEHYLRCLTSQLLVLNWFPVVSPPFLHRLVVTAPTYQIEAGARSNAGNGCASSDCPFPGHPFLRPARHGFLLSLPWRHDLRSTRSFASPAWDDVNPTALRHANPAFLVGPPMARDRVQGG